VLDHGSVHAEAPTASARLHALLVEFTAMRRVIPSTALDIVGDDGVRVGDHVSRSLDLIADALTSAGDSPDAVRRVAPDSFSADDVEHAWSTAAIETAFVINHVVDRQRRIARVLRSNGITIPEGFGSMELQPLHARSSVPPHFSLWRLLDELEVLIGDLAADVYCARFATHVSGSIGEHVRHCLDHVAVLVAADSSTTLSYDRRHRGTAVEHDPAAALRQIVELKRALATWPARGLDAPIRVASMISPAGDIVSSWSTLGRELAFVVAHTIHHQAIIGVLLVVHGETVPERFGHSPSTPRRH
jgi:hypothetical protein